MIPVRRAQVFVSGTWSAAKAAPWSGEARTLGAAVAASGFDLATGPGTGISGYVIDGFRAAGGSGRVRFYLPDLALMDAVGESVERDADETVKTDLDYPMRNVFQIGESCGVFVLTGGDGTLEEILPALIDYRIPVAVVRNSGNASRAIELLSSHVFTDWADLLQFGDCIDELTTWLLTKARELAPKV